MRDGVEGWLFEAGLPEAAARAMRACLAATPETLGAMGAAGRARVLARHQVDTEATKLLGAWRDVRATEGAAA